MRQNAGQSLVDCELTRQLPVLFSHRKNQTSRELRTSQIFLCLTFVFSGG